MSDLLTHWAIFDDSRRLALVDEALRAPLGELLQEEREMARLGALTRYGSKFVPPVLESTRARGNGVAEDGIARKKLAFALGAVTHYAADLVMKPLMSRLARADWNAAHHGMQQQRVAGKGSAGIREISAYYDTHVFRSVYLAGNEEPFSSHFLKQNPAAPERELEELVRSLFQQALLACHTLKPPLEDFDGWLERLIELVPTLYVDVEQYRRVLAAPDPERVTAYAVTTEFYVESDPVVRLARAVQRNECIEQAAIDGAIVETANRGGYGQALALSLRRLRETARFLRGDAEALPDLAQ
jgi:hypothetical protein